VFVYSDIHTFRIQFLISLFLVPCVQDCTERVACGKSIESCFHRTSNHAGDSTKSYSSDTTHWAKNPGPQPLFIHSCLSSSSIYEIHRLVLTTVLIFGYTNSNSFVCYDVNSGFYFSGPKVTTNRDKNPGPPPSRFWVDALHQLGLCSPTRIIWKIAIMFASQRPA